MQPDLSSIVTVRRRFARWDAGGRAFSSELRQTMGIGRRICAWLLGIALLAACSTAPPPDCAAQKDITEYRQRLSQAAGAVPYGQGLLWRVDGTDAPPSHVFGTAHSKDPRITRLAKPVAAAFETATSLAIEIVRTPEVDSAIGRAMKIPGGDVERLVGPERFERIRAAGSRYGPRPDALRQLKPWALYLLFSLPPAEIRDSTPALDFVLQESAEARGIPVYGLETVQEQLAMFDDLAPDRQVALLDAALAENRRIDCWWQALKDVYLARELGFYILLTEQRTAIEDDAYRVAERNLRMVERMAHRLAAGGAFVAVGALHLPGERGILNLLAARGYRISRVY
jgi:uncharacterized protein YbaP (TraB family)